MKVVRTATLRCRVDEAFRRHGGGWYMISGKELVLVGPALTVEKSLNIDRNGTAAASPDGKLIAIPGTDTLALYDDCGDQVTTVALRRWPDGSGNAVTFSIDGTCLLAVCAGQARGTAEIRRIDGAAGWAITATATLPVTNDVYPAIWAHPNRSAYMAIIGAGQDGQWSWWISDDETLTATEITALRQRAVCGVSAGGVTASRNTALSMPGAYSEEIAWHDLPSGNVIRRVDPAPIVGDDDGVQHLLDLDNWCLLVITGEGHVLRVEHIKGRPVITVRLPATDAQAPFGWAGATTASVGELLLWDHAGGIALASLASHADDSTADT